MWGQSSHEHNLLLFVFVWMFFNSRGKERETEREASAGSLPKVVARGRGLKPALPHGPQGLQLQPASAASQGQLSHEAGSWSAART